ncbi:MULTISPECIES: protein phosphatase 2C domain-containing protein [unclassified Ruegeria]|uniref:PP2C family protein-serine/threonine phosphatase n=1 Tax=unclassified Ruegeria TaxID=2625375 RepID=UPI001ADA2A4D|nr:MULTISPECIES: protein phosphatase 2C domain-containing protein [unclassified Ruegeria]MBO9413464.1 serine/threonine-protein phosphatase [Ruegeria sp. R8_1]MBO9417353.1 serine/threonine-protein phosphatase [Ruegeria sp. R8_2]
MNSSHRVRYSARSHVGLKRKLNEDAVLALPEESLWMVADGMGGHEGGDYASRLVADMVAAIPPGLPPADRLVKLRDVLQQAHSAIRQEAETRGGKTMGTTVACMMLANGHFVGLWAGDSRIYLLRDNRIQMLTTDHSVVADLVLAGQMSWDEAEQHPQSNAINRAVGVGDVLELDKIRGEVQPGDRFLICSDGLSKYATFPMLEKALSEMPIETVADQLIQIALDGGGADNISVIVVDIP